MACSLFSLSRFSDGIKHCCQRCLNTTFCCGIMFSFLDEIVFLKSAFNSDLCLSGAPAHPGHGSDRPARPGRPSAPILPPARPRGAEPARGACTGLPGPPLGLSATGCRSGAGRPRHEKADRFPGRRSLMGLKLWVRSSTPWYPSLPDLRPKHPHDQWREAPPISKYSCIDPGIIRNKNKFYLLKLHDLRRSRVASAHKKRPSRSAGPVESARIWRSRAGAPQKSRCTRKRT